MADDDRTCPKCAAKCTGGRHSTDDSPSMLAYACGTMVWSDGAVLDGRGCLINQIADLKAKLADIANEWLAAKRIGYEIAKGLERKLDHLAALKEAESNGE